MFDESVIDAQHNEERGPYQPSYKRSTIIAEENSNEKLAVGRIKHLNVRHRDNPQSIRFSRILPIITIYLERTLQKLSLTCEFLTKDKEK